MIFNDTAARSSEPLMCNGNEDLCSLKFNQVTFAGTHNSGSGFCGPLRSLSGRFNVPCFSRNQDLSFTEQLQYGIRSFDIDLCYIEQASARFSPAGRCYDLNALIVTCRGVYVGVFQVKRLHSRYFGNDYKLLHY